MEDKEIFQIRPKFNLIYELVMPIGRKLKRSLFIVIALIIIMILIKIYGNQINVAEFLKGFDAANILFWICVFFAIIFSFKFVIDMILKIMQYNRMTYTFYNDNMVYEDTFLNQQRKVIKYENIKEVEIRRSVLDRILGYGIIIISTNAEGNISSGLVIYGIKDSNNIYTKINDLVHDKSCYNKNTTSDAQQKNEVVKEKTQQDNVQEVKKEEIVPTVEHNEDFTSSLKNINK